MMALLISCALLACGGDLEPAVTLSQKIDAYLCAKHFQGSALIARQGEVLFSKGYGLANEEHGIPNTPQTVFRVGSITKQFTAIAILQLQEEGKLNVKDPLSLYFPDYPQGDKITLHHLLTHTSGIRNITKFSNLAALQRTPSTPHQVIAHFKDLPLEFSPGSACTYSDSGYILLGALIEAVTNVPYATYIQDHLLAPLKMQATYCDHHQTVIPNRASGYRTNAEGERVHAEFIDMSFPHGAGALASTVEDLYLWDRALKEGSLLGAKERDELFRAHAFDREKKVAYGYGFFLDCERSLIGHTGSIEGFRAAFYRDVENDVTLILLSNEEETQALKLTQELFSLLIKNKGDSQCHMR